MNFPTRNFSSFYYQLHFLKIQRTINSNTILTHLPGLAIVGNWQVLYLQSSMRTGSNKWELLFNIKNELQKFTSQLALFKRNRFYRSKHKIKMKLWFYHHQNFLFEISYGCNGNVQVNDHGYTRMNHSLAFLLLAEKNSRKYNTNFSLLRN